jgi:uncharacterized membrane protein YgcG
MWEVLCGAVLCCAAVLEKEERRKESASTYLIEGLLIRKRNPPLLSCNPACRNGACVDVAVVSLAGIVSCCRLVFGRALNAKIQVGASGSFCFQTEDSVAFIKDGAPLGLALVSKQTRGRQAGRHGQAGGNCRGGGGGARESGGSRGRRSRIDGWERREIGYCSDNLGGFR